MTVGQMIELLKGFDPEETILTVDVNGFGATIGVESFEAVAFQTWDAAGNPDGIVRCVALYTESYGECEGEVLVNDGIN